MTSFFKYIDQIVLLSEEEKYELSNHLKPVSLNKGELFLDYNTICLKIAFIHEGLLEMLHTDDHSEKTVDFFFSNSFATDYKSFLSAKPSETQIKALKKTQLLVIEKQSLDHLYDKNIKFQKIGRIIAEKFYLEFAERIRMQSLPPKFRYEKLCFENPELIQQIPQYKIASLLGVTPEWLSKLRSKL